MDKIMVEPRTLLYPNLVILVGAIVDNKPNFMTVGMSGSANITPPMVSIAIQQHRTTLKGIRQNKIFSVNLPSIDQIRETDFCGMVSGSNVNKVEICHFNIFYDNTGFSPMIEQCPINLACKVEHVLDLGSHAFIIGQVLETYVAKKCLTNGKLSMTKLNLFSYTGSPTRQYLRFGKAFAIAHSIGDEIKEKYNL